MRKRISDRTTTLESHNEFRLLLNYYYFVTNILSQNDNNVYTILMLSPFDILASRNRATKRSFDKISSRLPLFVSANVTKRMFCTVAQSLTTGKLNRFEIIN